jgi:hypothetical protein
MVDTLQGFELEDTRGTTSHFNGSVTTVVSVPAVADKAISELIIQNRSNSVNDVLDISFDGGSNFFSITRSGNLAWTQKGSATQIKIRSRNGGSVDYQILINFEEY